MKNEEKIVNKIIPIETIIEIANYLEKQSEEYNTLFEQDNQKNKDLSYSEKRWLYNGNTCNVRYTIRFKDGREVTEQGYNWFLETISNLSTIKEITLNLNINYSSNYKDHQNYEYMHLYIWIYFYENSTTLSVDGKNMEEQVNRVHSYLKGTIEKNEDRYNKTVKNRNLRMQTFCFSIGIVLSYLVYIILLINKNNLPVDVTNYLDNKFIIIIGQWFIAGILGNIFGLPIMISLYKNIVPKTKYSHYNTKSHEAVYVDNLDDFTSHNEVQIGNFYNNGKNRKTIEKIYKITIKIVLLQLLISLLFLIFMK